MKHILLALSLTAAGAMSACDDYGYDQSDAQPVVVEAAPAAEDAAVDVVEVAPESTPVDPVPVLPPDDATSEESVTPESETLFY